MIVTSSTKFPGFRAVLTDDPKHHTGLLRALREAIEIAHRERGDKLKSFVRLEELVAVGLADEFGNLYAPPILGLGLDSKSAPVWHRGTGSPENVVAATVGSLYSRLDGGAGTTLYVKESGTGNTGWVAK